ncbi:MAG: chromosome segregation protein SMC, partial [Oscillospiraceae bacterium]|nr:chromosome segregation protein SMC [Oscillospiraceae bacterium]
MKLKALDIIGFKSFADKTRLEFAKPVTVIVGPNGMGKSNIADAVLWVTGEQSAKSMRGTKMEDVIFGGTKRRSQTGYAEVSLTLINDDDALGLENSEVVISRRYYRSGESEYSINRKQSRLRDVQELLMDTGLGRDGYSVIGQGKIDEILSVKGGDRRDIFEEAVGIAKYRQRREESSRKLAQTDENLTRLGDKLSELELTLAPLREQAETAKKYLLLRDEMRSLEISLFAAKLASLAELSETAKGDLDNIKTRLRFTQSEVERVFRDTERTDESRRGLEAESDALRVSRDAVVAERSEISSRAAALSAELRGNEARIDGIKTEVSEETERGSSLEAQIAARNAKLAELSEAETRTEADTASENEMLRELLSQSEERDREYLLLTESLSDASFKSAETKARLSGLVGSAQELTDRETAESAALTSLRSELSTAETDVRQSEIALKSASDDVISRKNVLGGFRLKIGSRREKAEKAEREKRACSSELESVSTRIRVLESLERDYEGYAKSVRAVMSAAAKGTLRGIVGTVGDLLRTDAKYALAVETALGASVGSVVVGSEEDGKSAINMLKRTGGGRATFLPITTVRGSGLSERGLESEPGFEGVAFDLVETDEKVAAVIRSLLGRTAIAATLDDAIKISRKYSARFKVVSLDGQVINAGGAMTGGSSGSGTGIISRAGELETLRGQSAGLKAAYDKLQIADAEAQREKAAAEFELEAAELELRDAEALENRCMNEFSGFAKSLADKTSQKEEREASLAAVAERIKLTDAGIAETRAEIGTLTGLEAGLRDKISEFGRVRSESVRERDLIHERVSALRERAAAIAAEKAS